MSKKIKKIIKWTALIGVIASTVIGTPIAIWLWIRERKKCKQLTEKLNQFNDGCESCFYRTQYGEI